MTSDVESTASRVDVIRDLQRLSTPRAVDLTRVLELGGVPQRVSIRGRARGAACLTW